jgi:hypothetical protein
VLYRLLEAIARDLNAEDWRRWMLRRVEQRATSTRKSTRRPAAFESTPVSGNDKNVSELVKTHDGSVDDPVSKGSTHPNPTAERLDEQIHSRFEPTAI